MDFHLERTLHLNAEPAHKSLYSWAIVEFGADGKQISRDLIPWEWTLYFTAISCELDDGIEINSKDYMVNSTQAQKNIHSRKIIRVQLRPCGPGGSGDYFHSPELSMLGTERVINDIRLIIYEASEGDQEGCTVWGGVSYTTEVDFIDQTIDDCIMFNFYARSDIFTRYADAILQRSTSEIIFSVGGVSGFYSEWSPSISTRQLKVLTCGREQVVSRPTNLQIEPPRLGHVGEATIRMIQRLSFNAVDTQEFGLYQREEIRKSHLVPENKIVPDFEIFTNIKSIKKLSLFIIILMSIVLILLISKY